MIEAILGRIAAKVKTFRRLYPAIRWSDYDDCYQTACVAALEAYKRCTPGRDPAPYALRCVEGALLDMVWKDRLIVAQNRDIHDAPGVIPMSGVWSEGDDCWEPVAGEEVEHDELNLEQWDRVMSAVESLAPRRRETVMRLYGLDGGDAPHVAELARRDGIRRQNIARLRDEALKDLRRMCNVA
jgi:RNA polymerase sigma factor (sigma-70 family)